LKVGGPPLERPDPAPTLCGMRWSVVGLAVPVLLVVGAVAAYAYDRSREGVIGEGVRIGGVVVGGMSADEAAEAVRAWHERSLRRPVVVGGGPRRFVFPRPRGVRASTSLVLSTRRSSAVDGGTSSRGRCARSPAAGSRRRPRAEGELLVGGSGALHRPRRAAWCAHSSECERQGLGQERAHKARALGTGPAAAGAPSRARPRPSAARSGSGAGAAYQERAVSVTRGQLAGRYPHLIMIDRARFRLPSTGACAASRRT
jgi:hypothetical protein